MMAMYGMFSISVPWNRQLGFSIGSIGPGTRSEMPFHRHADIIINLMKWPSAGLSVLILPPAVTTFYDCIVSLWRLTNVGLAFCVGIAVFALAIGLFPRLRRPGFWATFEHEMTHVLFALLTFHPVGSMQATSENGGWMTYGGRGNWLITISPYFFPTAPLLAACITSLLPGPIRLFGVGVTSMMFCWHIFTTIRETHVQQTDLQDVGFRFAFIFLPGISVLCAGITVALTVRGGVGWDWYWTKLNRQFMKMASDAVALF